MAKKWQWVVLVCALAVVVAACSKEAPPTQSNDSSGADREESQTVGQTQSDDTTEDSFATLLDVSYLAIGGADAVDGNWAQNRLEEHFNINIENVKVNILEAQQVDLMLASGEMPDFAMLYKPPLDLFEQGVTRTIPRHLIEEYAPHYAAMLDGHPMGWKINQAPGQPDEYMALTGLVEDVSIYYHSNYRLDWLENLGIQPNGSLTQIDEEGRIFLTDKPFTQEQHLDILRQFVAGDPDRNGARDTFGMSAIGQPGWDNHSWSTLLGMYGIGYSGDANSNIEEDGKTINFFVSRPYKEFLKYMAQLYQEGLLDTEFVTHDWARYHETIAANKVGFWMNQYHYYNLDYLDRQPAMVLNNNPEAKVLVAPPERGNGGLAGTSGYGWNPFTYNQFVGSQVDDEKLIRLLQFFDYIYFDPEARIWARFGQEGVHWEWSGEPENSSVRTLENPAVNHTSYWTVKSSKA